jgi:hypothetical protein
VTARKKNPKKAGAKPIQFDLEEVEKLGALHASNGEVASWFNVAENTIDAHMTKDPAFLNAYKKGAGKQKMKLRRQQVQAAESGNITMLIWLGKQLLGQQDFVPQNITISNQVTQSAPSVVWNAHSRDAYLKIHEQIKREARAQLTLLEKAEEEKTG